MFPVEENPYHEAAGHERRHAHSDNPVIFKGHLERQHPGYVEREIATCGARAAAARGTSAADARRDVRLCVARKWARRSELM